MKTHQTIFVYFFFIVSAQANSSGVDPTAVAEVGRLNEGLYARQVVSQKNDENIVKVDRIIEGLGAEKKINDDAISIALGRVVAKVATGLGKVAISAVDHIGGFYTNFENPSKYGKLTYSEEQMARDKESALSTAYHRSYHLKDIWNADSVITLEERNRMLLQRLVFDRAMYNETTDLLYISRQHRIEEMKREGRLPPAYTPPDYRNNEINESYSGPEMSGRKLRYVSEDANAAGDGSDQVCDVEEPKRLKDLLLQLLAEEGVGDSSEGECGVTNVTEDGSDQASVESRCQSEAQGECQWDCPPEYIGRPHHVVFNTLRSMNAVRDEQGITINERSLSTSNSNLFGETKLGGSEYVTKLEYCE